MKRIAVLCPGPSLTQCFRATRGFNPSEYEVVIGVNTAGWLFTVDWLAFSDTHIIAPIRAGEYPEPRVGYITNVGQAAEAAEWSKAVRCIVPLPLYDRRLGNLTPELEALARDQNMTECAWTFPNALCIAQRMAAGGRIDVFGFDCAMQTKDAAGQDGYHTRKRWLSELPWIKSQWGANVTAISMADPRVTGWLAGSRPWEDVLACFPDQPGVVNLLEHRRE